MITSISSEAHKKNMEGQSCEMSLKRNIFRAFKTNRWEKQSKDQMPQKFSQKKFNPKYLKQQTRKSHFNLKVQSSLNL